MGNIASSSNLLQSKDLLEKEPQIAQKKSQKSENEDYGMSSGRSGIE